MTLFCVTGQIRSGGSAVAEVLHTLGVPMALTVTPPAPPTWRLEWEDMEIVSVLYQSLENDLPVGAPWLKEHLEERIAVAGRAWNTEHIGLKSPFLTPHVELIDEVANDLGVPVRWLVMDREQEAIDASLAQFPWMHASTNREIDELLPYGNDTFVVKYERLVAYPTTVVDEILEWTGLPRTRRDEAIASVKQPTSRSTSWAS